MRARAATLPRAHRRCATGHCVPVVVMHMKKDDGIGTRSETKRGKGREGRAPSLFLHPPPPTSSPPRASPESDGPDGNTLSHLPLSSSKQAAMGSIPRATPTRSSPRAISHYKLPNRHDRGFNLRPAGSDFHAPVLQNHCKSLLIIIIMGYYLRRLDYERSTPGVMLA